MSGGNAYEKGLIRTDRGLFTDKGNQVVNICHPDFAGGAKGGGVDDTRAIQAAINFLAHSSGAASGGIPGVGGVLYVPTGIYSHTGLTLNAADGLQNITIKGDGPLASVLLNTNTAGGNAISVVGDVGDSVHGLNVEDIGVHGNSSSGVGIYCERVIRQVEFDRVDVFDHGTNGIEFITTCNMIGIKSCRIRGNGTNGVRSSSNGEQVWLYGNSIRDNGTNGISIASFINIFNVYGGDINGNAGAGVSIFGSNSSDGMVTAIELRGIYFEQNDQDVLIDNQGSTNFAANIIIAGNSFSLTNPSAGSSRCIDVKRGQYIYIYHNEFRKITDSNIDTCINIDSEAEDVYIGPNWFPTSTTRTKLTVHASATRTWGYLNPDSNPQEFTAWGPSVSPVTTFGTSDATPSVAGGNVFLTGDTGGITDFDDGVSGQEITVISKHTMTFDTTTAQDATHNLDGSSGDIATETGDITTWICEDGTRWILKGYIDISDDNSAGA